MPRKQHSSSTRSGGREVTKLGNLVNSKRRRRNTRSTTSDCDIIRADTSSPYTVSSGYITAVSNQPMFSNAPVQGQCIEPSSISTIPGCQSSNYQQGHLVSNGNFQIGNMSNNMSFPQAGHQLSTTYPYSSEQPSGSHQQEHTTIPGTEQGVSFGHSTLNCPTQQFIPVNHPQLQEETPSTNVPEGQGNIFSLQSVCSNLAIHVSQKIKEQIWNNEFIQLECLLDKNSKRSQSLKLIDGKISVDDDYMSKEISTISMWTDAFLIFIQIMLMKNISLASDLIQYMHTIRLAAKRSSTGWLIYDKLFRRKLSQYCSSKWSVIDGEIWLLAMTPQIHQPLFKQQPCFQFNNKGYCSKANCSYQHLCKTCKGPHSSNVCKNSYSHNQVTNFRPKAALRQVPPRFPYQKQFVRPRFYTN